MKYVIYTRMSKVANLDLEASSHAVQIEGCLEFIGQQKHLIFSESNISRDTPLKKCPVLIEAIDNLERDDVLVVWKLDRLLAGFKKHIDIFERIKGIGAKIYSVSEPNSFSKGPESSLFLDMKISFAKYELNCIRERTKNKLKSLKANGFRTGHIPYGYRVLENKKIKPDAKEQERLALMHRLKFSDYLTYRGVAEYLNKEGLLNRWERPWSGTSVHRTLTSRSRHAEAYLPQEALDPA